MLSLPRSEILAIAKLFKSPDEETKKLLEEQLKKFDIKLLRGIYDEIGDLAIKGQFLELVGKLKREELKIKLSSWVKNNPQDLQDGVFLVASFGNPFFDFDYYSDLLDKWALDLEKNLKKIKLKDDPTSIISEVNHFLFMELGFQGNKEGYYEAENSFIDKVIERKLGNPILLSVIYILVSRLLGLPFSGVNMPSHFLVQYHDAFEPIFIDPFNQGEIVTKENCKERIKALRLSWQEDYLSIPTNKQIVARILQNLANIYHNEDKFDLKDCIEDYIKVLKN